MANGPRNGTAPVPARDWQPIGRENGHWLKEADYEVAWSAHETHADTIARCSVGDGAGWSHDLTVLADLVPMRAHVSFPGSWATISIR